MILTTFLVINAIAYCSSTIVIPPKGNLEAGEDVGVIFVQGAQIEAKNYQKYFEALQSKFTANKLWVAMVEFPFSVPQPLMIKSRINDGFKQLKDAGFNYKKETPFFFIGHSLGGVMVQDYVLNKDNQEDMPAKFAGLVLEGATILRKNYELVKDSNLISSILTIGGELDGLNRISRMSESVYFDEKFNGNGVMRNTHLVLGMNHFQFSGEGKPYGMVKSNDIKAEITNEEARDRATTIIAAHMRKTLDIETQKDREILDNSKKTTSSLAKPLIEAFKQEGSYHFNTPCYSLKNPEGSDCTQGSPWVEFSQKMMGSFNATMQVTDSFHPVYQINPVHLPDIHNKCDTPYGCTLNVTTVSEPIYGNLDSQDISLWSCAASEIKAKLMSRQSVLLQATGQTFDLNVTDGGKTRCAEINQATIQWALERVPRQVAKRYLSSSRQLRVGQDIGPLNVGPLWIWTYMQYNEKTDDKGTPYIEVKSPMMNTPVDYPIAAARGFHYCKVLSPAKAMEWMYIDSIKP